MSTAAPPAASHRERALRAISDVPPLSPILAKLIATLDDPDISFAQLGELIEKDTMLAGNILRLVNSAFYGRRGQVNSVRQGVSILGVDKIRNVSISLSINQLWKKRRWPEGWSPKLFNLHAAATAVLADLLAVRIPVAYPEGAFTAGLLHNVGIMPIALGLPGEFVRVRESYLKSEMSLPEAEQSILGFDHASLSAEILKEWKLPEPIQEAAAGHHAPLPDSAAGFSLASLISLADWMVQQEGILVQHWHRIPNEIPAATLASYGLEQAAPAMLVSFRAEFGAMRAFFDS